MVSMKFGGVKREPLVKSLSDCEFRAWLDKWMCFCCNIYSHDHCCKVRENCELMFIMNEEEEIEVLADLGE